MDGQRRARRLQDDRRRQDLGEGAATSTTKTGAIDLVMDPADPNTLYASTWQRIRLKWNDPRNVAGLRRQRRLQVAPTAARRGRRSTRACREPKFAGPHRPRRLPVRRRTSLYAFVDNYEIAREPTEEEKADPYGLPSCRRSSRAPTVYRSDDKGATWTQMSGLTPEQNDVHGAARRTPTAGCSGRSAWTRPTRTRSTRWASSLNVSTRRRQDVQAPRRHRAAITTASGSTRTTRTTSSTCYDQGFAISYDRGATWKDSRLTTCPLAQFFNVSYDMDTPFRVYGSMQDHGSFRGAVDLSRGRDRIRAADFESAPGGEGSTARHRPAQPEHRLLVGLLRHASAARDLSQAARQPAAPKAPAHAALPGRAAAPARAVAGADRSSRRTAPDVALPRHAVPVPMSREPRRHVGDHQRRPDATTTATRDGRHPVPDRSSRSPSRPCAFGLIYAGTDDGRLHVTRDGGKTWTEITAGLPAESGCRRHRRVGLRRRHRLHDAERQARRRLHAVRLEVDRLRQDLDEHRRRTSRSGRST
ncbi:MAG: hypothetical protein MZW92_07485 [Comamonadaceae bacterium]|nr:hypothetical protein [Comamonadaceae bacterium]